jgi:predicted lipoprotein with Yx(FWY)xxD motif
VIKAAAVGRLGTVVVDGKGMTLYLFAADSNKPPASRCDGSCAKYWPPLLAGAAVPAAQGVSTSLLGTVARSDGTKQVTLNGWPLYTYAGDHAPGQANGEGLNAFGATWWALTATGQKTSASGSSSGPSSSPSGSSGGGYGGY